MTTIYAAGHAATRPKVAIGENSSGPTYRIIKKKRKPLSKLGGSCLVVFLFS